MRIPRPFRYLGVATVAMLILVAASRPASALPAYSRLYQGKYGYRVSCQLCHTSGGGSAINNYGRDFLRSGANLAAFTKIEKKDSDGDGGANLDEIKQKANPGDPRSTLANLGDWLGTADKAFVPEEQLKKLFPTADAFAAIEGGLKGAQVQSVEKLVGASLADEDKVPTFYFAMKGGKRYAVAQYVSASSAKGPISIAVAMDTKATVSGIKILKNPSEKAIESPDFTRQFGGKTAASALEVGKDIKPAAGAEADSRAVAEAVRKAIAIINAVFGK